MQRRTIIVTGAARGMGRACALRLASAGDHVVAWDIDARAGEATAEAVREHGGSAEAMSVDCGDTSAAAQAVLDVAERTGRLDGLVHAAGVMRTLPLSELDEAEYDRLMNVNLRGTLFLVKAFAEQVRSRGPIGSIVLFSSVAGRKGRPLAAHYAASKAALISVTQSAAMFYGPEVRVNAVCPGVIATPMMDQIAGERHELLGSAVDDPYPGLVDRLALKRIGEPDDVAKVVEFLLGPLAGYVTGQAINVDGGLEFH